MAFLSLNVIPALGNHTVGSFAKEIAYSRESDVFSKSMKQAWSVDFWSIAFLIKSVIRPIAWTRESFDGNPNSYGQSILNFAQNLYYGRKIFEKFKTVSWTIELSVCKRAMEISIYSQISSLDFGTLADKSGLMEMKYLNRAMMLCNKMALSFVWVVLEIWALTSIARQFQVGDRKDRTLYRLCVTCLRLTKKGTHPWPDVWKAL